MDLVLLPVYDTGVELKAVILIDSSFRRDTLPWDIAGTTQGAVRK
jgi:hypothetical protein